ncbi:MAG: nucleotidyltransferase domain-containing protein [bacterium]
MINPPGTQRAQREKEIQDKVIEIIKKKIAPCKIILFGSRAKGKHNKGSDFDFAVDSESPGIRAERKIMEEIDEIAGLYKVDIVYLGTVDETFKNLVLKTGKVVYERGN